MRQACDHPYLVLAKIIEIQKQKHLEAINAQKIKSFFGVTSNNTTTNSSTSININNKSASSDKNSSNKNINNKTNNNDSDQ